MSQASKAIRVSGLFMWPIAPPEAWRNLAVGLRRIAIRTVLRMAW